MAMDTTAILDVSVMNKFISNLSKSLQALCHGCMDFDDGVEMIGYININIDSENSVDCVLNEKVKRSSNTNSMTFISNSFLARKEKAKVMRDATCSPVPELENRDFGFRKCRSLDDRTGTGKKRHRKDYLNTTHSASQGQFENFSSHHSEALEPQSYLKFQHHIKQEVDESSLSAILSPPAVKREHTDVQTEDICQSEGSSDLMGSENISSDHPGTSLSHRHEYDQSPAEVDSMEQTIEAVPSSINQREHNVENVDNCDNESVQNEDQTNINTCDFPEDMNEQSSFLEEGEKSTGPDEFEVIEIGDDDEVQGLFAETGPQNILLRDDVGSSQRGPVWNSNRTSYSYPNSYLSNIWRERRNHASRIYRLNMSQEQRERERLLARIRQRRRRARIRQHQQDSLSQALEAQYNVNFRHSMRGNTQKLESSSTQNGCETNTWR